MADDSGIKDSTTTTLQSLYRSEQRRHSRCRTETYPAFLELKATATDSSASTNSTSVQVNPQTANLNFATSPTGLQLTVDGVASTAPFSRTVIVNSTNSVVATSPQTLASTSYFFSNWSDAGAATHNVVAPAAGGTFTANYTTAPGPVAEYNFDAGSGTERWPTSQAMETTARSPGPRGSRRERMAGHFSFTADNQMVTVADSASLHLTTALTAASSAWSLSDNQHGNARRADQGGPER